jgi:hypothetical protein
MDLIVEFMVRNRLADGLLAEHVDDGSGHCRGCAWQQAPPPIFPCSTHYYAARASEVAGVAVTRADGAPPDHHAGLRRPRRAGR